MGFYIRKSVKVGPLRFNLSKSGIGVSAGIKGFRVGSGPRGNYVHMGGGGVYYRASLDSASSAASPSRPVAPPPSLGADGMQEIESASVLQMVDASSAGLVEEMNRKQKGVRLWPWILVGGFFAIGPVSQIHPAGPAVMVPLVAILTWWTAQRDALRLTTVLMYDFEDAAISKYQKLHDAFDSLMAAGRVGHLAASGNVSDRKRNAGAGVIVRRHVVRPHKAAPKRVSTNVEVPAIPVGRQTLYFFPDRLLVVESAAVGAVSYKDLGVTTSATRFIESEGVPSDAQVVDHTWQYVNKKGGPDKRFKNNRQLPIALYEEIHFTSPSGLNEVIQASKVGTGALLREAFKSLAETGEERLKAVVAPA